MKYIVIALCLLFCLGCSVQKYELDVAECFCKDKEGICLVRPTFSEIYVLCKNGKGKLVSEIKHGSLDCLNEIK